MTCFVLFEVIFLFNFFSLLLKSFLFAMLAISVLLPKFACFSLAAKFSDVKVLNSEVVIYLLLWSWSVIFFSILLIFYVIVSSCLTKLLTLGILSQLVIAKLLILGIIPLTLFILALREALVVKLVVSDILSPMFFISALYTS